MNKPDLHLASASPRRRDILTALGLRFTFGGADIDESPKAGEAFPDLVLRLAAAKAGTVFDGGGFDLPVLGADTIVVLGDQLFGKPESREDALHMLAALSGRTHRVLTGVALCTRAGCATALAETSVRFREIDPDEAAAYWQSGEPAGKAGAYAIQGVGGVFVQSIEGSYSGVVGLPVYETAQLLQEAGIVLPARTGQPLCREYD
jgi:septum formation protein